MSHEEINPDKELNFIAVLQAWKDWNAETGQAETRNAVIFLECDIACKSLLARKNYPGKESGKS